MCSYSTEKYKGDHLWKGRTICAVIVMPYLVQGTIYGSKNFRGTTCGVTAHLMPLTNSYKFSIKSSTTVQQYAWHECYMHAKLTWTMNNYSLEHMEAYNLKGVSDL